ALRLLEGPELEELPLRLAVAAAVAEDPDLAVHGRIGHRRVARGVEEVEAPPQDREGLLGMPGVGRVDAQLHQGSPGEVLVAERAVAAVGLLQSRGGLPEPPPVGAESGLPFEEEELEREVPRAQLEELAGAGHGAGRLVEPLRHPQRVAQRRLGLALKDEHLLDAVPPGEEPPGAM